MIHRVLLSLLSYFSLSLASWAADDYAPGPDSLPQPGVPQGQVHHFSAFESRVFPGTVRDYGVYVPAQYDPARAACLMVVQDGKNRADEWRLTTVLDNLIHRKEIPIIIGIFVNPGVVPAGNAGALPRFNRSFEYDSLGDRYARFLLEELLPAVGQKWNLSQDPKDRLVAGASSGAICAFTAAWERPNAFGRVLSTIGTYVGLRDGNDYPTLIRKTEPKPIRVYLQDGSSDLNIYGGDWWVANQDMLSALQFAGYDVQHAWGDGGHNGKHAAAIMPEAMRWLWRDHPQPIRKPTATKNPFLSQILIPGSDWEVVSEGHRFTEGPAVNEEGEVYFTDIPQNRIYRIDVDGKVGVFAENTEGVNGLMFGPNGALYGCAGNALVRYDKDGKREALITNAPGNDLVVLRSTGYYTDPGNKKIWYVGEFDRVEVDSGIAFPNGIVTSPDQSLLYVADTRGAFVWSFQIQADGRLAHKQPYFHLHLPSGATESGADGMTVDTDGRLYVTTALGLQVFDQAGRCNAVVPRPQPKWLSNVVFGGEGLHDLYVTCSDKVYRRKTRATGVLSWRDPIRPAAPRL